MPTLLGILGKKRHGKDTVSDYIVLKYGFKKDTLAQPIKDICKILFDFSDEQLYGNLKDTIDENLGTTPRAIFQYLGTDILRKDLNKIAQKKNCENLFVDHMKKRCANYLNNNESVIISDIRCQNEVDAIHEMGGIIIKIDRPNFAYPVEDLHESEKNIDNIADYDHLIDNSKDIESLYDKITNLMNDII